MLSNVIIEADPISEGGFGGLILTVNEHHINAPTGDLGVSSGGDDYGTASYIGEDSNGDYRYRLLLRPPEILDRVEPEIAYLEENIPDERIQEFIDAVDEMLNNYHNSEINSVEALEVAVLLEDLYVYADIMIMDNPYNYSDDEISTSVGDEMEEEIPYLSRGVQKKVFGMIYEHFSDVAINLSGPFQSGPASLGGNDVNNQLREMLRYAFLNQYDVVPGNLYTNSLFDFSQANNNFSYNGSFYSNWSATIDGVRITIFDVNVKFSEVYLRFPAHPTAFRNSFIDGDVLTHINNEPIDWPYQILMRGVDSNGNDQTIASFFFSDGTQFYDWYVKYRTGND